MTKTIDPQADTRTAYTTGLRALADLLDGRPDIPVPTDGNVVPISICSWDREQFLSVVQALTGKRAKRVDDTYYRVDAQLHGLKVQVVTNRDEVCERVVTGTREVTREVPDPEALAAVPTTVVTETVEDVEWVCAPLLSPAEQVPA